MTGTFLLLIVCGIGLGFVGVSEGTASNDTPWSTVLCFLIGLAVVFVGIWGLIDEAFDISVERQCELFGYARAMSYRGDRFCVGYTDQEPYFVAVESIEDWK